MPCHIPVSNLQYLTLQCLSKLIRRLCEDKKILLYDLAAPVSYLQKIPASLQSQICAVLIENYKKEFIGQKLNEKHNFMLVYLQSEELYMNEFNQSLLFLNDLKGCNHKKLSLRGATFPFPENFVEESERYRLYRPLYNFMTSLRNLKIFQAIRMCDDLMFELFAQFCPNLEEIDIELSYTVSDDGVCYLCGFSSTSEVEAALRTGDYVDNQRGCKKLKRVTLDFTMASNLSVAALLQFCPTLEVLNVNPDINIGEVFTIIHGFDTMNFDLVTRRYSLTTLRSALEIEENILALIVQTCPNLQDIAVRCYGIARKDKNLLAHLLHLPIHSLDLMNCNTEPLLWYLERRGKSIEKLIIEHLITAPQTVYLNRSHIQFIISACPNLIHFSLKMCGNVSIAPNVPYSYFGSNLKYFTSLRDLSIEGVNLLPDDIRILLGHSKDIEEVSFMCHSLDILEDTLLYELLAEGALRNLRSLYAFRPLLTFSGLKRLLAECPYLKKVGPLSSWGIPKGERDKLLQDIKENNWDLNIEAAETLQGFFF